MEILDILREAVEARASDILLSAGAPVTFHIQGRLETFRSSEVLDGDRSRKLVYEFLTMEQRKFFEMERDLDVGYHVPDLARFRVSVFQQRGTVAAVLRIVPFEIPHYRDIGLSDRTLMEMVNTPSGLILITGPTGAGKSTTIASYIEYLNAEHGVPKHIITLEDPIEYMFQNKSCLIDQRELGMDTKGYVRGLKAALRQMPHVIFVGEMRDRETIETALTAAETGNIVISTLSTQSAGKTVNRIIDVFPLEHQAEIRTRLSLTLRAVVSQVLLRRADADARICAREIMFVNNPISNLIREGKVHQLNNAISTHARDGMNLMDDSLIGLCNQGLIGYVDVMARLADPEKARALKRRA